VTSTLTLIPTLILTLPLHPDPNPNPHSDPYPNPTLDPTLDGNVCQEAVCSACLSGLLNPIPFDDFMFKQAPKHAAAASLTCFIYLAARRQGQPPAGGPAAEGASEERAGGLCQARQPGTQPPSIHVQPLVDAGQPHTELVVHFSRRLRSSRF